MFAQTIRVARSHHQAGVIIASDSNSANTCHVFHFIRLMPVCALTQENPELIDMTHVQVPNPLPLSWGRTIKPYVPKALREHPAAAASDAENEDSSNGQQASTSYVEEEDILQADFKSLRQPCQAVLINLGMSVLSHVTLIVLCSVAKFLIVLHYAALRSAVL